MDTQSSEDRFDAAIDEVARALTDAPHGDIAGGFAVRLALRRRLSRRILVPAIAAAAVILALATMIELRAPGPAPVPPDMTVVTITPSDVPLPAATPGAAPVRPELSSARHATRRRLARMMPDPPLDSDLAPAPLTVAGVAVAPMSVPDEPAPPSLSVEAITVAPIDLRGGSR